MELQAAQREFKHPATMTLCIPANVNHDQRRPRMERM